ncbi:MAG: hypothetical protein ABI866_05145 [Dokdonella sp.]
MAFVIAFGAFVMNGVPAWEILFNGPFRWHIAQPESWQGGIEALILGCLIAAGFYANRSRAIWLLVVIPVALYARRHAFDVAIVVDLAYLEIIIALGFRVRRWCGVNETPKSIDYLHAFATGFLAWSLCAWVASALNLGSIHELRWLTLILATVAFIGPQRPATLCRFLFQRVKASEAPIRVWCAIIGTWLLVMFARTKVAIAYDARWYGLQPEHVLVPNHSIFEPLGLVSPVHYYPKIYEMWLLPVSALGDNTIISGMTLLVTLLLLGVCRQMMRDSGLAEHAQLPVLALIATVPALAEIAGQPKPDVFATFFILLSGIAAIRFIRRRSLESACWLITGSAVACSAKLTAIPYAGLLLLIVGFATWKNRSTPTVESAEPFRPALVTAALAVSVAGFVAARTWLLTGLPTIGPDPLFKLWHLLGFTLREPAGTLNWAHPQDWPSVPLLLFDHLFRPQLLGHIITSWTGNVWLWFVGIATCAAFIVRAPARKVPARILLPMAALALLTLATALGVGFMVRGGDGNYFLFGLLPTIILSATAAVRQLASSPRLGKVMLACIPAFVLFQAGYSFISGSWKPGTRAFDAKFSIGLKGMQKQNSVQREASGINRISEKLRKNPGDRRVIGRLEEAAMFVIPARYEDLAFISYSRPEFVADAAALLTYMHDQQITCMILPGKGAEIKDTSGLATGIDAAKILKMMRLSVEVRDSRYIMTDASNLSESDWQAAIVLARAKIEEGQTLKD